MVAECHVKTNHLSVEDLARAEQAIVSHVQQHIFQTDIESLQEKGSVKTSRISNLDPFLDVDGILKVGGRLSKLAMPVTQQHPTILSKDYHVSKLIMRHIHKNTGHCGRNYMVSKLRQ